MWNKIVWGLGIITVLLLIGFSLLIIPTQMEQNQMREEAKATEKRLQGERDPAEEQDPGGYETPAGIPETTVEPNNPVYINESHNIPKTTEPVTVGIGATGEVFRYKEGIYKGMTYPEAVDFWRKRVREAYQKYKNVQDKCDDLFEASINASLSGVAILATHLRQFPLDIYERALDRFFENDPKGRESFEAYMKEVEQHSYSGSLVDQISSFADDKDYRQKLSESLNELRIERDKLKLEHMQIFKEIRYLRRNRN